MALIDVDWKPGSRQLRQFATLFLIFGVGVGTLIYFFRDWPAWIPQTLWIAAPIVGVLGWIVPRAVLPIYVVMMAIALPIGMVVSTVLMLLIYFVVMTPIGGVMRLVGYDPMQRRLDRSAKSYWIRREDPPSAERYLRQY